MKYNFIMSIVIMSVILACGCSKKDGVNVDNTQEISEITDIEILYYNDYYIGDNGQLMYYDNEKKSGYPLCFKPNCNHEDGECDSLFKGTIEQIYEDNDFIYCMTSCSTTTQIERCKKDGSNHELLIQKEEPYSLDFDFAFNSEYLFTSYSYLDHETGKFNVGCIALNLETKEETNIFEYKGYQASCTCESIDENYVLLTVGGYNDLSLKDNYGNSYEMKLIDCSTLKVTDITDDLWGYSDNLIYHLGENSRINELLVKNGSKYDIHIFDIVENKEISTIEDIKVGDDELLRMVDHVNDKYIFTYDDKTAKYYDTTTKKYTDLKVTKSNNCFMDIREIKEDGFVIELFDPDTFKTVIKFVDFDTFFNVDYFGD
ncbi:MAG: hypothetical protein K6G26_05585 [Lachnospiraceae bacterium]|nr:hypothetical protein [Lachnospiraceae bacterium]